MSARKSRIWQSFDNFESSMKAKLKLIYGYDDWIQTHIDEGWSPYLLTFMFTPLRGTLNSKIPQMKKEVENFYSKLLTRVVRRPNSSCDKPALIASFDFPVAKRNKISTIDALVNDGLHVHAILLIPPKSRLRVPLAEHIESNHEVYLRDRRKLDRVDVQPFYTEESLNR